VVKRVTAWFDDWVNLGENSRVLNKPHGRAGMDVEAGTAYVEEAGSHLTRYYVNHAFLTPSPGVDFSSFDCVFQHAMSGEYGGQWWSYNGYFYPPDHGFPADAPPTCAPIVGGELPMEVQSRLAGYGLINTDGSGDYLQGNSNAFALGFHLRPWLATYGPDAGWGLPPVPAGATLEWEFDTPDFRGIDAAGDEDVSVPQPGIPGAPVKWVTPQDGLSAHYDEDTGQWSFHTGQVPFAGGVAFNSGEPVPGWLNIDSELDLPYVYGQSDSTDRTYDLIATAVSAIVEPPTCAKPGSLDAYRREQWLAIRVRMRARRYRFVYDDEPVVRQWPRDSLGLAAAPRQVPPTRTRRVVGGHH